MENKIENSNVLASPGDLLENSWKVLVSNWKLYLKIESIPFIMGFVLFAYVFGSIWTLTGSVDPMILNVKNSGVLIDILSNKLTMAIILGAMMLFLILTFVVIAIYANLALIYAILRRNQSVGLREAFKYVSDNIWTYVIVSFLVGWYVMFGIMLFILPGIVLAIWFIFSSYVVMDENKKGLSVLLTSRGYMRGRWREVGWRMFVVSMLTSVIGTGAGLIGDALSATVSPLNLVFLDVVVGFAPTIFSIVTGLYTTIFMCLLYENVKSVTGEVVIEERTYKKYKVIGWLGLPFGIIVLGIVAYATISFSMYSVIPHIGGAVQKSNQNSIDYNREYNLPK
ncbi:MAG: hypothetical protein M3P33_01570 [bacterium]|nr:hypothetical protein [bacterium]